MRFGQPALQSQRFGAGIQNVLDCDINVVLQEQERIAISYSGVSACIEWVQVYGFGEHASRQLIVSLCRPALQELSTSEVVGVSFDVIGRRLTDRLLFLWQQ